MIHLLCIVPILCSNIFAEPENRDETIESQDSTQSIEREEQKRTVTANDTVQSEKLTKKQLRAKKREERKKNNDVTISAHKSMLVGSSNHKHGFTKRKKGSVKGPLQPQTICPVMGGPIDKRFYADYNGYRIYVCCEGCIYQLKRTPKLYFKTLKRYGEKPIKVPKEEPKKDKTESNKE